MRRYMNILVLLVAVPILTSCAGMADSMNKMAGIGVISEDIATFDGAKTIKVSPNWLYESKETWSPNEVQLGTRWKNTSPDLVVLDFFYGSDASGYSATYLGLSGMDLNVDGEKLSYSTGKSTSLDSSGYT